MEDSGIQILLGHTSLSATTYDLGTNVLEHAYGPVFPWYYILRSCFLQLHTPITIFLDQGFPRAGYLVVRW